MRRVEPCPKLVSQSIELPSGELRLLQPQESVELPDAGAVEWAPIAPYWSVLWRSGVALACELEGVALRGLRVVELGCGLAVPSIAAARRGAAVLATDACADALALVARNAHLNDVRIETATVNWAKPDELVRRAPFDLVLAADVLYEPASIPLLLSLLPRLAPEAWLADPGRPATVAFLEQAGYRWPIETRDRDLVLLHRLQFGLNAVGQSAQLALDDIHIPGGRDAGGPQTRARYCAGDVDRPGARRLAQDPIRR